MACGTCLHVCPVFGEEAREALCARGRNSRIRALLEGPLCGRDLEDLSKCLLCGRCAMVCPRGIRNDLIVAELRRAVVEKSGLPTAKKTAFTLLQDRKSLGTALRFASKLQCALPKADGVRTGLGRREDELLPVRRLPSVLPRFARGRAVPSIAKKFLSDALPEFVPAINPEGKPLRAAYFSGCATEYFLPDAGKAVVRLLSEAGMDVVFPKDQGCCGLAAHANGDAAATGRSALRAAAVLEKCDADYIVTGCATCGSAMRDLWPRLGVSAEEGARLRALAGKVRDVSEAVLGVVDHADFSCRSNLPRGAKTTWHEPCHLVGAQGVSREPLTILRRVFGDDFHELPRRRCCGFGGTFSLHNYGLSQEIGAEKAADLRESGAEYVITSCPGCLIQLADVMARHNIPGKIVHLAEAVVFRR